MKPKVSVSGWIDLVGVGVFKQVEERVTSPYIGNGTLMSGAIKGAVGAVLHGKAGRIGNLVSTAFLVDAGEDLALAVMAMTGIGGAGGQRSQDEFGG
jgi:hypothetical protein